MTNCHLIKNSKKKMGRSLLIIGTSCHRDASDKNMEIVTDIFTQIKQEQNLKKNREFRIPSVNTVCHGSESTSY